MFVRIWHKADNVGSDDPSIEGYVAIRYIMRFYRRKYDGAADRYMVATGTETSYVTQKTFNYLKSLRHRDHHTAVQSEVLPGPPSPASKLTRS